MSKEDIIIEKLDTFIKLFEPVSTVFGWMVAHPNWVFFYIISVSIAAAITGLKNL